MMKFILATVVFSAAVFAQDAVIVPKQPAPLASQPQANVAITPDGDIVIVPVKTIKNGVMIPIIVSPEDAEKQRAEMAKRKADRAAKSKSASASSSSSSSVKAQ